VYDASLPSSTTLRSCTAARRIAGRQDIGDITLGDAIFWRKLHESLGPFYPVGPEVLDYVRQTPEGISAGQRA
jgi:hypothetical protein